MSSHTVLSHRAADAIPSPAFSFNPLLQRVSSLLSGKFSSLDDIIIEAAWHAPSKNFYRPLARLVQNPLTPFPADGAKIFIHRHDVFFPCNLKSPRFPSPFLISIPRNNNHVEEKDREGRRMDEL